MNITSITVDCEEFHILDQFPQTIDPFASESVYVEFCPSEKEMVYVCVLSIFGDVPGGVFYIRLQGSSVPACEGGEVGDANGDGTINIIDALDVVNHILEKVPLDANGQCRADCNLDEDINIMDVIGIVNVILGIGTCPPQIPLKGANSSAVIGMLETMEPSGRTVNVPIFVETEVEIAGMQFTLLYDQDILAPTAPQQTSRSVDMTLASSIKDGSLNIVLYSPEGMRIPAGSDPILTVHFRVNGQNSKSESSLRFENVILAEDCVTEIPTRTISSFVKLDNVMPKEYALSQNYPNPFNPETSIDYQISEAGMVRLAVFNTLGQRVRTLVNGVQEAGFYTSLWDGRDEYGQLVSSGIYFYRLTTGGFSQMKRMVLMK